MLDCPYARCRRRAVAGASVAAVLVTLRRGSSRHPMHVRTEVLLRASSRKSTFGEGCPPAPTRGARIVEGEEGTPEHVRVERRDAFRLSYFVSSPAGRVLGELGTTRACASATCPTKRSFHGGSAKSDQLAVPARAPVWRRNESKNVLRISRGRGREAVVGFFARPRGREVRRTRGAAALSPK